MIELNKVYAEDCIDFMKNLKMEGIVRGQSICRDGEKGQPQSRNWITS